MQALKESELIINPDGSIYHLNLLPSDIADTIITVGDPERVKEVSKHFDTLEIKKGKREFVTHTGHLKGNRITVISTGIGTDNIDIVFTELDALANIDFKSRKIKEKHTTLRFVRIGTSGALQADIPLDSFLVSSYGLGLDGLMCYYDFAAGEKENTLRTDLEKHLSSPLPITPYLYENAPDLAQKVGQDMLSGITATCTGFYAPQGRQVRGKVKQQHFLDELQNWSCDGNRVTNFEMETAGIYGMAKMLGHEAISCNALLANRAVGTFSNQAKKTVEDLIAVVLERLF